MAVVALPMLSSVAPRRPRSLPSSIQQNKIAGQMPKAVLPQSTYQWNLVQNGGDKSSQTRRHGVHISTLCVDVLTNTFESSSPHMARLEKDNFKGSHGGAVWCYLVGGICVILKGMVVGRSQSTGNRIARLPEGLRPARPLCFAALARDAVEEGGRTVISTSLATILVTPDGDIIKIGGGTPEASIDLSAIRFCTDKGISLVDEVSVHTVDIGGTRLVTLQGRMLEQSWRLGGANKVLTSLPESCRPGKDMHFVVPGVSREGFHLVHVKPLSGTGHGGDITWKDSIWVRDRINLTGIMYEVASSAMHISVHKSDEEKEVSRLALMTDFHRRLVKKYGSVAIGLQEAFGMSQEEELNFTQFVSGTKALGYPGHMTRLWAALDDDMSGEVSYEEVLNAVKDLDASKAEQLHRKRASILSEATMDTHAPSLPDLSARLPLTAR